MNNEDILRNKLFVIGKRLARIVNKSALVHCNKRMNSLIKMLRSIVRLEMFTYQSPPSIFPVNKSNREKFTQWTKLLDAISRKIKKGIKNQVHKVIEETEQLLIDIEGMVNDYLIKEAELNKGVKPIDEQNDYFNDISCGLFTFANVSTVITCNFFDDVLIDENNNGAKEKGNDFTFRSCLFDT